MAEAYMPSLEEVRTTRTYSEELKISGDGIFATLQGEGITAGRPSVFIRLQNCNLHCGKDGVGWRCDAWYTWDASTEEYWKETRLGSIEETVTSISQAWTSTFGAEKLTPNLVLTGGEPLLQQEKIEKMLPLLSGWDIEVETNGTIVPIAALRDAQINCSPKLASSGNELRARRRTPALQEIAKLPNHWFKFVISREEDIDEVKEVIDLANGGDFSRVLLMSEGTKGEDLARSDTKLESVARELGCRITARNQIFWYGDKRAT